MKKVEITFDKCGYEVYPIGTKVKHGANTIRKIENVFITKEGEVRYVLEGTQVSTYLFTSEQIDTMVLHQIEFNNDL